MVSGSEDEKWESYGEKIFEEGVCPLSAVTIAIAPNLNKLCLPMDRSCVELTEKVVPNFRNRDFSHSALSGKLT